jgi:N-acetyltransferase
MDNADDKALIGKFVRLEPMCSSHVDGLAAAASVDPSLYGWSPVPQGAAEVARYVDTALAWKQNGTAVPYVIVRIDDGVVVGSTRFWNLERWSWPDGHIRHGRSTPDACEIGYTWLTQSAVRTAVNTESKLLMLTHAFDAWQVLRVCFHADVRNQHSRTALERIGVKFEGILRSHRLAVDLTARDSATYSVIAAEWPDVKERLRRLLERR